MNSAQVTALARVDVPRSTAIEPQNMSELQALAKQAASTGFFGAKTMEAALIVMMAGRDLGLSYSQALRAFHVIEGKPTLSADGMVAACLQHREVCETFRTVESTDERATVLTKRVGSPEQRYTFTLEDAKRAGLAGKGTWQKYPSRMLLARARAALARDVYPDLLLGLYDPDEFEPTSPPARAELRGEVVPTPTPTKAPSTPPPPAEPSVDWEAKIAWAAEHESLANVKALGAELRAAFPGQTAARAKVVPLYNAALQAAKKREEDAAAAKHAEQSKAEADAAFDGRQPGED